MIDNALAERIKSGDMAAFEELVRACERQVFNLALRYTNNPDDAKDVSQEVFLRVYRSIGRFKGECAITTWVYRIAVNVSIDMTRKSSRRNEMSLVRDDDDETVRDITDDADTPEERYERTELRNAIRDAIASLPPEHKQIIILRDINGMSYEEIGGILSLSEGTVKSRLFRARDRLRAILGNYGNILQNASSKSSEGGATYA